MSRKLIFIKKEVYLIYGEHNGKAGYVTRQKTLGIVSEALIFSSVFDLNKFMKAVSLKIKFGIIKYELNFKDIVMLDSSMDNKDIIELKAIREKEILDKTLGLTDSSEKNSQKKCSTKLKL